MSTAVFPTLAGIKWNNKKTPLFKTGIQTSLSGRELRTQYYSYPRWNFALSYEFLRDGVGQNELKDLVSFFLLRGGSYDSFYYNEPSDNSATNQTIGTGDGSTLKFALVRVYGSYVEPVFAVQGTPSIMLNGAVQTTGYSIANGVVTFTTAPAAGVTVSWTGNFYFIVRFKYDMMDFNQFMKDLWEAQKVDLITLKP